MPLATGFMPTARRPRAACARSSAHAATVLPTPVSVPVTNMPLLIAPLPSHPSPRYKGSPALARGAIEAHDRPPVVDETRFGLPRMSINDLEACRQAPIAAKVFQRRQHPLPPAPPREGAPAIASR